jgi:hypothetical protein
MEFFGLRLVDGFSLGLVEGLSDRFGSNGL